MSVMDEYRSKRLTKRIRLRVIAELLECSIGLISNWENSRGRMAQHKVKRYMEYVDNN